MAKETALVTSWRSPVPGREAKSLEVFMDFLTFWGKKAADGKCSEPEAYLSVDGFGGFAIVRGKSDVLHEIAESDEALALITKGQLIVDKLQSKWYFAGDEVTGRTSTYAATLAEMGYE